METPIKQLVTAQELVDLLGISRMGVYRLTKRDDFPTAYRIGPNSVRWRAAEVEAWVSATGRP